MLYASLSQLKSVLEIGDCDTLEDKNLMFYAEWASRWIEERINRPDISYALRTEYYDTNGTQRLKLNHRPVYPDPEPVVHEDLFGAYGQADDAFNDDALEYGNDYVIQVDRPNGRSYCGILIRLNNSWPRRRVREGGWLSSFYAKAYGGVKVTYAAGYTVDDCPPMIRLAANTLVAKMRTMFPVGMEVGAESYKDRSLSYLNESRNYLMSHVEGMLANHKNFSW